MLLSKVKEGLALGRSHSERSAHKRMDRRSFGKGKENPDKRAA
jgi:hypothetical protein